ncbi:MAG: hypothetical protein ABR600_13930 [Actinomycetota bacterium]
MAQRPQFDMSKMSTASKILLGAGLLYLIDMFLAWNKFCLAGQCSSGISGWHGIGFLNGIIVILIVLMEILLIAGVQVNAGTTQQKMMTEAGLAGALLVFTILRVLLKPSVLGFKADIKYGAWIGLILALVIAYGGYMRWQESKVGTPPPASPAGGGFAP